MNTKLTLAAASVVLALAGCSAEPTAPQAEAALHAAVQAYSDAYLSGNGEAAYALLSKRCQKIYTLEWFSALVDQAKNLYGNPLPMTSFKAHIAGGTARVTYTYTITAINQTDQPWTLEAGGWRDDNCWSAAPAAPAEKVGTRDNPAPVGTTVEVTDMSGKPAYTVTIGPAILNADAQIAQENQFNEAPKPGMQYLMISVTYVYKGSETGTPGTDVNVDFVSAAGTTHKTSDVSVVTPNDLDAVNELYPGATATGNIAILVPSADVEKGTFAVSDLFGSKKFFVKVG